MFKNFLLTLVLGLLFFSCKKGGCDYDACGYTAPATEIQEVQTYLTNNSITATQHCSGLFYKIENPGTGSNPSACSSVTVRYKGMLQNGTVFDQATTPVSFNLGMLITSWRNGLPLIKAGGKIILYVPPSLGYGDQSNGTIPAHSILVFEVELIAV